MPTGNRHNVRVRFEITDPYFRYIWTGGSFVKVNSADFLGKRELEVTRATNGYEIVVTQPISTLSLDEGEKEGGRGARTLAACAGRAGRAIQRGLSRLRSS
jgi:hypothetical protein